MNEKLQFEYMGIFKDFYFKYVQVLNLFYLLLLILFRYIVFNDDVLQVSRLYKCHDLWLPRSLGPIHWS